MRGDGGDVVLDPEPPVAGENQPFGHRLELEVHGRVDSARALTGARYGAITAIDEAGRLQDFVTSGLTADEQRQLEAWPHATRFFEYLRDLPVDRATASGERFSRRSVVTTHRRRVMATSIVRGSRRDFQRFGALLNPH